MVTRLDLGFNILGGAIPPELGNLANSRNCHWSINEDLSGPQPDTFTGLTNIQ